MSNPIRFGKNTLFVSMWAVSIIVAFTLPDNPERSEILGWIVRSVGSLVPAVSKVRQISAIPEVAATYFAIMWLLVVIWAPPYFWLSDEQIRPFSIVEKKRLAFLFSPLLVVLIIVVAFNLPIQGRGRIAQVMMSTRFGLACYLGLMFSSIPLFIRAMTMWFHYIPRLLNESNSNQINKE